MPVIKAGRRKDANIEGADYRASTSLILDESDPGKARGCIATRTTRTGSCRRDISASSAARSATRSRSDHYVVEASPPSDQLSYRWGGRVMSTRRARAGTLARCAAQALGWCQARATARMRLARSPISAPRGSGAVAFI
jgi:hypothetical protein